jgi:hypothetical protein
MYLLCRNLFSDFLNAQWNSWFLQGVFTLVSHFWIKCNICDCFIYSQYYLLASKAKFLILFVSAFTSSDEFLAALLFLSFASIYSTDFVSTKPGLAKRWENKIHMGKFIINSVCPQLKYVAYAVERSLPW